MRAPAALLLAACAGGAAAPDPGAGAADPPDTAAPLSGCSPDGGPPLTVEVGAPLTLSAELLDGAATAWLWDLGDGTVLDGQSVTHTYAAPGVYPAVVQCTGSDGTRGTDAVRVTAHLALATPAPRWSATLALSPDGATLYAVSPEADAVARIDAATGASEVLPACAGPRQVATDGDTLAVTCGGPWLDLWDDDARTWSRIDLPAAGHGVVGRDGTWWVTLPATGQLARISGREVEALDVGPDPRGVALLPDGGVVVTRWRSSDAGGQLYTVSADGTPGPDLWLEVDESGDSDTTTGGVPNLLEQVVPSPDGGALYLPFSHANAFRGAWLSGQDLTHESTLRAVVATVAVEEGAEVGGRKQLDERGRANALAPSPLGERLYVLHTGTRSVTVLDTWTGDLAGSILDVGHAPTGLAVSPDGDTLYVYAWLDRQVHAYDVTDLSAVLTPVWSADTVEAEPLAEAQLLGKRVFWDAQDPRITRAGYISCANCHPDGSHDGRTWDFTDRGEGLRNTPSLLGRAGMAMGPVHWSANFDEIQDFENDMRGPFGGAGFLSAEDWAEAGETLGPAKAGRSAELDALAAYVASLDATPPSPFPLPTGGAAAFAAAGCGDCHPAPLYTDSSLDTFLRHDVGTLTEGSGQRLGGALDGLDTPTLLGAWATGPYLHDGSAETLEAAIEAHAELSPAELALLADFVRAL